MVLNTCIYHYIYRKAYNRVSKSQIDGNLMRNTLCLQIHICICVSFPVLEGGPEKIQELRTSRPFYQAHQEAHALLESTCLPSFHHSYEVKIFSDFCSYYRINTRYPRHLLSNVNKEILYILMQLYRISVI